MSDKDESKACVPKLKVSVRKKKAAGRMSKLNTRSWYEIAARSVAIDKKRTSER